MNEDGDNFTPPSFENFKVVGGPSQSSTIRGLTVFALFKSYSYFYPQPKENLPLVNLVSKLMEKPIKLLQ